MAVLNSYLDYPVPTKIDFISRCWLGKLFAVSKKLASFKIKFLDQWWLTPQVHSFLTSICLVEHPELLILAERNASIFVQWEFPSQRSLNLKIILWLSFLGHEAYTYIYLLYHVRHRNTTMNVVYARDKAKCRWHCNVIRLISVTDSSACHIDWKLLFFTRSWLFKLVNHKPIFYSWWNAPHISAVTQILLILLKTGSEFARLKNISNWLSYRAR